MKACRITCKKKVYVCSIQTPEEYIQVEPQQTLKNQCYRDQILWQPKHAFRNQ